MNELFQENLTVHWYHPNLNFFDERFNYYSHIIHLCLILNPVRILSILKKFSFHNYLKLFSPPESPLNFAFSRSDFLLHWTHAFPYFLICCAGGSTIYRCTPSLLLFSLYTKVAQMSRVLFIKFVQNK